MEQFYVITCTVNNIIVVYDDLIASCMQYNSISYLFFRSMLPVHMQQVMSLTRYTCTLHAVTIYYGQWSDPFIVTTPKQGLVVSNMYNLYNLLSAVLTAPVVKNLTAINDTSILIEWNILTDTNGVITIYIISYAIKNGHERNLVVLLMGQNVGDHYIHS